LCLFLLLLGCLGWTGVAAPQAAWAEAEGDLWPESGEAGWRPEDGKPGHAHHSQLAAVRRVRSADEAEPAERAGWAGRSPVRREWSPAREQRLISGPARRTGPARAPPSA